MIRKHIPKEYGGKYSKGSSAASVVRLQTFFTKSLQYFRVANLILPTTISTFNLINTIDARRDLNNRYQLLLNEASPSSLAREPQYISEITPWLRVTNFHIYKQAIGDIDDFREVLRLPRRADDVSLSLIYQSIDRLVRQGLDRV